MLMLKGYMTWEYERARSLCVIVECSEYLPELLFYDSEALSFLKRKYFKDLFEVRVVGNFDFF